MAEPVKLYAISTCGWCRRTKRFLEQNKIPAEVTDVDQLEGEEKEKARAAVAEVNPRRSYPTLIIGDQVVVGYDEDRMRELLEL
jgi:glutaredoxin-like protein NrdH